MDDLKSEEQKECDTESIKDDEKDSGFKFGMPRVEEDEPLENMSPREPLDPQKIAIQEKDKERRERRYFSAFRLIVGCLIFLGLIYVIDVVDMGILKKGPSSITKDIIEIIKTLLFTLSGYLFARKQNGD